MPENRTTLETMTTKNVSIPIKDLVIGIKSAGEMATGIACRLFSANLKQIFMMETHHPRAVRRTVSFCETIFDKTVSVEDIIARKVDDVSLVPEAWNADEIPVITDPLWTAIETLKPQIVIDAIIAKKNLGTRIDDAPLTIGLGPGFIAGVDVDLVIETNRGHNLGRVIAKGPAEPNTGIPGNIGGVTRERVLRAPCHGIFTSDLTIGSLVKKNDIVGTVGNEKVMAEIDGMIRGLIRNGTQVSHGLKIGDIDPRGPEADYLTVSEKARAIGGSILEAILSKFNK